MTAISGSSKNQEVVMSIQSSLGIHGELVPGPLSDTKSLDAQVRYIRLCCVYSIAE